MIAQILHLFKTTATIVYFKHPVILFGN